jgi:all-trans-retinol dehydrogenase (NAD+)
LPVGLTSDPLGTLIKRTALNPAFTLLFLLLARYTKRGSDLSILHSTAYSRIKTLFYFGLVRLASGYFDQKVLDNWTSDEYDWSEKGEIVLITGGAGGIGGQVVKLLAERGTRVVVLDVIPMTFEVPKNVYYYKCDITSPATLAAVGKEIRKDVGNPTILINNAGKSPSRRHVSFLSPQLTHPQVSPAAKTSSTPRKKTSASHSTSIRWPTTGPPKNSSPPWSPPTTA